MRVLPILIAVGALGACTAQPDSTPQQSRAPAATPIGAAVDCLETSRISDSHVWDDRTIDFRVGAGQVYRNTLPQSCSELGFEQRFAYTLSIPRLCSTDIITVLHSGGGRGASCGLGQFVPVQVAPAR